MKGAAASRVMVKQEQEPGHLLGNFHSYYKFNSTKERLKFLSPDIVSILQEHLIGSEEQESLQLWDIGCNEGNLTLGLVECFRGNCVLENDLEREFRPEAMSELNDVVQRQKRMLVCINSRSSKDVDNPHTCSLYVDNIFYGEAAAPSKKAARIKAAMLVLKRMSIDCPVEREKSLVPRKITVKALGTDIDPVLIQRAQKKCTSLDNNVQFKALDVMDDKSTGKFHIITCFSVIMWIHLNHGDDGLFKFLDLLATRTDGCLLLEIQSWKSYRNAFKRLRRMGKKLPQSFMSLKVRDNVEERIDEYIRREFRHCYHVGQTSWKRNIKLYCKRSIKGMENKLN